MGRIKANQVSAFSVFIQFKPEEYRSKNQLKILRIKIFIFYVKKSLKKAESEDEKQWRDREQSMASN